MNPCSLAVCVLIDQFFVVGSRVLRVYTCICTCSCECQRYVCVCIYICIYIYIPATLHVHVILGMFLRTCIVRSRRCVHQHVNASSSVVDSETDVLAICAGLRRQRRGQHGKHNVGIRGTLRHGPVSVIQHSLSVLDTFM
jgi:hypothetical protein